MSDPSNFPSPPQPPSSLPFPATASWQRAPLCGLAIASFVLSIVWGLGVLSFIGLILGIVALRQIKRTGRRGRGFAIAGTVLGAVGSFFLALGFVLAAVAPSPSEASDLPASTASTSPTPTASPTAKLPTATTTPTPTTPATTITTEAPTTTAAPTAAAPTEAPTTEAPTTEAPTALPPVTYTVLRVVDGDTVDIHASDGDEFTVRFIGIDAPEAATCEGPLATKTMTDLVNGRTVALTSGGDGEDVDKYGRFLRYVDTDGTDAGLTMISMGLAKARYDSRDGYGRHDREDSYVAADETSADYTCPPPTTPVTVASAPRPTTPKTTTPKPPTTAAPATVAPAPKPTTPKPTGNGCDSNYTGCVPIDSDVDCAGGSGNGPSYVSGPVRVIGSDIYGLDRDGDGLACE